MLIRIFVAGSSDDELDNSRAGLSSAEDDSMESTMVPQPSEPSSASEPLNLLRSEYHERRSELHSPSDDLNRNSPLEYSQEALSRNSELDNLRIRSVDQLISPENLKLQDTLKLNDDSDKSLDRINGNIRMSVDTMRVRSREGMLTPGVVPHELKLREKGGGVWSRKELPKGTRYGPFLGKWLGEQIDPRYSWEVSDFYF